jgi:hypothetical protein
MMAIMLDPCFKTLHIVENLVGHENVILLTSKYDIKVVIPLLMVCFDLLNPIATASITIVVDVARLIFFFKCLVWGPELRYLFEH